MKHQNSSSKVLRSSKGLLNIFDVIVFNNSICTNAEYQMNGTCYKESECKKLGGSAMGSCADGIGVCCVFKYNCGSSSREEISYFENFEYPHPSSGPIACTFSINLLEDIQQIFLEFHKFELERPTDGDCFEDEFSISGQNRNFIIPSLCGVNTGQHMFVDVDQSQTNILHLFIFGKSNNRRSFKIKATQLKKRIAPRGCLQYFTGSKGIIQSFNYQEVGTIIDSNTGSYLNNLNYAICIEREENMCSISYTNIVDDDELEFHIVNTDTYKNIDHYNPFNCPDDFLVVNGLRLCGDKLSDRITQRSSLNEFVDATTLITDYGNGPIILSFRSDGMHVGRGFQIIYEQNYCDSKFLANNHLG